MQAAQAIPFCRVTGEIGGSGGFAGGANGGKVAAVFCADFTKNHVLLFCNCQQMGGGKFNVYVQQVSSKLIDITVEHHSNTVITSTLGLEKATITGPA